MHKFFAVLKVCCQWVALSLPGGLAKKRWRLYCKGLPRMGWFYETRPTFTMHAHVFCALVGDGVKVRPIVWVVAEGAAFFIFQALCLHF
mmetsp:Transcript_127948/g.180564  ORF Transcript_127948/g.180564 Transcript_127948/m.180564 type:complete len:89 (-) Transcript_127948:696-962(-)